MDKHELVCDRCKCTTPADKKNGWIRVNVSAQQPYGISWYRATEFGSKDFCYDCAHLTGLEKVLIFDSKKSEEPVLTYDAKFDVALREYILTVVEEEGFVKE